MRLRLAPVLLCAAGSAGLELAAGKDGCGVDKKVGFYEVCAKVIFQLERFTVCWYPGRSAARMSGL
jgi:hypothetical protein